MNNLTKSNRSEMRFIRPYVQLYNKMQKKIDKSFNKFQKDIKTHKNTNVLVKDQQELMFLLGELNYLTIQCKQWARKRQS